MNLRKNKFRIALIIAFTMLFQIFQPVVSGLTLANERDNTEVIKEQEIVTEDREEELDLELEKKEEAAEKGKNEAQQQDELHQSEVYDKLDKSKADDINEAKDSQAKLPNETEEEKKSDVEINETEDLKDSNKEIIEKEENVELQANREAKKIEENIIDDMKLLYKDGTEFEDGDLIGVNEDLRFELDWSLPNDKDYVAGDNFEFELPKQVTVYNPLNGTLGAYGSYTVDTNGNVKFIFNEIVESESDIKGTFWFDTELKESEITSTEETIELVVNGEVVQKVVVNVKPKAGQAISKKGQPVDGNFNTQEIDWTVVVNTTRDSLKNAIIDDPILVGQELILGSVKLTEVEVDLAGKVIKELEEITGFINNSKEKKLNIELGDTNKAYKLTFKTKLLEESFKEGTTNYENTAYLKSDGVKDEEAGGSVSVSRPKSIEKTSSAFDKEDRSIEWTVNANFTEQNLKKDDVITDEFKFTVGKDEITDVFEIKKDNIEILQVDKFDDKGKATETSNAKDLFDITVEGNKVTYKLKEDSNKAFILKYKTEVKEGAYINKDGKITNKIDLNGKTSSSSQGVIQQVGKKTNAGINYEDKTINWTITVNADKQDLSNFVLTDSFAGSGQKLVANSIKITPDGSGATITANADNEGFEINFGDITEKYVITYQTKFTYEKPIAPNFKNGVNITYKTSDGSDYELKFDNKVTPNKETKSNGAKNGTVDNDTKEITWKVDINYNQLILDNAKMTDAIPDNQSLIDDSVKVYETSVAKKGDITVGNEVTDQFTIDANENQVNVDFGAIEKSYRVEFKTKDKDGIYNSDEKYTNTAIFTPREEEVHNLTANVTLPNQGEFIGKTGIHNKEDWTIDWKIDVNKSLSTTSDFTVKDNLGDPSAQILLEDTIKVTKAGSTDELEEGEGKDYKLTVEGNKFEIYFPGEITEAYEITYSSYIIVEENETENGTDIKNEAKIQSNDVIKGTTEKTETVTIKISTGGGTGEGTTGGLVLDKFEADSERKLKDISFKLIKTIGNKNIVVREGVTDDNGKLEWKGLKYGKYTLKEEIPEGYLGEAEREIELSSKDPKGVKTLRVENTRETGKARIIKVDSVTNELLEGAEFKLKNQTTNQEFTYKTDEYGVILKDVPFGEYTVEEITAPKGYRITKEIPNITVEIGKTATIEVENVAFVDVVGQKTWITDKDKELPKEITVELLADGKNIAKQKVTKNNNWKYSFKNLDKYNIADREIKYEIKEVKVDGYIVEKDGYDLTNIQTTNISGTKTWMDDNNPDRPKSITVQLLANGEKLKDKTVVVTEANNWEYFFNNLAKYDSDGNKIIYTIEELAVEGYKTEIDEFNITNTREAITSVKGEKTWKDENPTDRPKSIEVNLTRKVKGEKDTEFIKTETIKPNAKGEWLYEFTKLDEFDENGVAYNYIIEENNVPDKYESTVDGYNLINTRVGETEVSGTKRWKDDKVTDRPESIKINLLRNNVVIETENVTADNNWKYKFTKLDKYDEDGKYYKYTVKEEQVPGYAPENTGEYDITNTRSEKTSIEITKGWLDGNSDDRPKSVIVYVYQNEKLFDTVKVKADEGWVYELTDIEAYDEDGQPYIYTVKEKAVEGYKTTIDGFNITNLRVGKTDVSGKKIWKDNNNATGDRPEKIKVKLLKNGEEIKSTEVTTEDNWEYSFTDLDKYDENGVEWGYTVDEVDVDGYTKSVDENDLINTRTGLTEVSGKKIWKDNNNATGDRPEKITVNLLQNGTIFAVETVEPDEDGNWNYSFKHLPRFDENGVEWGYTLDEEYVDRYKKSTDGNDLINTRTGRIEVSGEKIWKDNNNATGDRPEKIIVNLLQNGTIFAAETVEPDEDENWNYSFKHLPRFDENGVEWGYTVDEEYVEGYTKSVDGNDLINTRTGLTEVSGNKIWKDDNNATGDRPEKITVNLLQNGTIFAVETVEPDEDGNWNYSFKHLPRFDENGVEWGYTVDEEYVEGYTKSVDGNDLINTRTGLIEVSGKKIWKDDNNATGDRPEKITVNLLQNGTIFAVETVEPDEDGNWNYSFKHLPRFDDNGVEWKYKVDEEYVEGYTKSIDGYSITNTRTAITEITGTKEWIDGPEVKPTIELQLYRNGEAFGDPVELVDGETQYTWTDLDEFDENGKRYEYTIDEVERPENYGKSRSEDKLTITNTYESPVTDVVGRKVWIGGPEEKATIELQLYRNGEAFGDPVELIDGETEYTWIDLDLTDNDGVEYEYTVKEVNVPENYGKVEEGLTVTNRYVSPKTEITGTKVWIGGPEKKPTIELQLYRNGEAFGDPVKLKDGNIEYVWKDLDLTDKNGLEYKYTIDEVNVPENYIKTLSKDGLELTNKYSEPKKPTKPAEPGLPPTGTQSTMVFTLLGIMIVLIGMTLWFNERKRKSNTK